MSAEPPRPLRVGVASDGLRLRTERLLLRRPQLEDDLSEFVADVEVQRWTGGADETAAEVLERWVRRWERNDIGQFVVELDGRLIGRVGFVVWDRRTWETSAYDLAGDHAVTELGWAILQRDWSNGYATEAALAARDWAGLDHLVSLIDPANERSIRVAAKLGAARTERVQTPHGTADVWVHPQ